MMIPLPIQYTEVEEIFSQTIGNNVSTLAVSAANDGEGVSMLAYALSRRAAAMGRKTLLVDFNCRHPSVGRRLGIEPVQWVPGQKSALENVIALSNTGLHILPAPEDVSGWLTSREISKLEKCFDTWRESFDCIIADTSPLTIRNQENFPPENVCAACEGTVLVVLTGRTSETNVMEACKRLAAANARITGAVLNDRFAPALADELIRESHRLDFACGGLLERLRGVVRRSVFLNQSI